MSPHSKSQTSIPAIIAHRGASHDAPENTLAAFRLAWEQNADGIEGDFHFTNDGRIVCSHDATTTRCGDKDLEIASSSLDEVRQVDVGAWKGARWKSERIPTIEEVLAVIPPVPAVPAVPPIPPISPIPPIPTAKKIYIEIYDPKEVPAIRKVIAQTPLPPEQTIIISFERKAVAAAKREIAGLKAFWLVSVKKDKFTGLRTPAAAEEIIAILKETHADGVDCKGNEAVDAEFIGKIRDAGFEFHVWTVDKAADARRFMSLGVDSITTNRPAHIREHLSGGAIVAGRITSKLPVAG